MAADNPTKIIVGIHGVGTPAKNEVVENILEGYTRVYRDDETTSETISLQIEPDPHVYRGIQIRRFDETVQIWEVNWSDLKGLPEGKLGTALYALKAVVAMLQISDEGWQPRQKGITGKLFFGCLLRSYFCTFSLVAPLSMLALAFAFIQNNWLVAVLVLVAFGACIWYVLRRLLSVDRRFRFSFPVLVVGLLTALWVIWYPSNAPAALPWLIWIVGAIESILGTLALLAIVELLVHRLRAEKTFQNTWTVFISRAGMLILGVTMGSAVYGAVVNAIAFFLLGQLVSINAVVGKKYEIFETLYLQNIGYNLPQMEFINWLTTFGIGAFLVGGIGYQFYRISTLSCTRFC
jgi:hypothetical protein